MANNIEQLPPYQSGLPTYNQFQANHYTAWIPSYDMRPYPNVIEGNTCDYMVLDADLAVKMSNLLQVLKTSLANEWSSRIWDDTLWIQPGETIPLPTGDGWYNGHKQSVAIFWFLRGDRIYEMARTPGGAYNMINKLCDHNINGIASCAICQICRLLVDSCGLNPQTMPDCQLIRQMFD